MADPKTESELELEKLKELERTLAQELDQQVRLTETTDVRLTNTVAMNPSFESSPKKKEPPQAPTSPSPLPVQPQPQSQASLQDKPAAKQGEEINLQDVDNILNDLDESFKKSMDDIKNEISLTEMPTGGFESIPIGKDYLETEKSKDDSLEQVDDDSLVADLLTHDQTAKKTLGEFAKIFFLKTLVLPYKLIRNLVKQLLLLRTENPKQVLIDTPFNLLSLVRDWYESGRDWATSLASSLSDYGPETYFKLVLIFVISGGVIYLVSDISKNFRTDQKKDPYLRSFKDVANSEELIPEEDTESHEYPFKHPEYIVYLKKIVANLKVPSPRYSSMISVELFVEASDQDAAVEIHEREVEIKDLIERIAEQSTFDELDTKTGKEKFKGHIITALNHILNKGRAKKVFFKSLQIKK